jgi:Beta-galactosidase, domain 2
MFAYGSRSCLTHASNFLALARLLGQAKLFTLSVSPSHDRNQPFNFPLADFWPMHPDAGIRQQWEETLLEIARVKYFEWGTVRGAEKRAIRGLEEKLPPGFDVHERTHLAAQLRQHHRTNRVIRQHDLPKLAVVQDINATPSRVHKLALYRVREWLRHDIGSTHFYLPIFMAPTSLENAAAAGQLWPAAADERAHRLPDRKNFQVELQLRSGVLAVPRTPINIPSDAYTIWPVDLDIGGTLLRYATAQLLCKLNDPQTYVFFVWPGISPEFAFEEKEGTSIESVGGQVRREGGTVYVDRIEPGTQVAIRVRNRNSGVNILVLSREQALNTWKTTFAGKERVILSPAELYFDRDRIHVRAQDPSQLKVGFLPALGAVLPGLTRDADDGVFQVYSLRLQPVSSVAKVQRLREMGGDPPLKMGKEVAMVPDDSAFDTAASWTIAVPPVELGAVSGEFLRIAYEGDVARLYVDGKLLTDNFYNGTPWLIGLDRIPSQQWDKLELKILPLREHAPIYLPEKAWPAFPAGAPVARVKDVQVLPEYEVVVDAKP